jgi:hypothetical protein
MTFLFLDELENDRTEELGSSYFPRGSLILYPSLLDMAQNDLNHLPHYQKAIVLTSYPLYDHGGITIADGRKERKCNQPISTKTYNSLSLSLSLFFS